MPSDAGSEHGVDEELTQRELIRKRGYAKRAITNFANYLGTINGEVTPTTVFNLEDRLSKLHPIYDEFNNIQMNLLSFDLSEREVEDINLESDAFSTTFSDVVSRARYLITQCRNIPNDRSSQSGGSTTQQSSISFPKIELPKFTGEIESWLTFRDTYVSLIHTNTALSAIQKHHYLRSSLSAEALLVISGVDLTADGYERAWELLNERYENRKALLAHHLRSLFNIPTISRECAQSLRSLVDSVATHISAARALRQPVDQWDALIIHLINSKLDIATTREWEQSQKDKVADPSLEELLKFLRQRADIIARLDIKRTDRTGAKPINDRRFEPTARIRSHTVANPTSICAICKQQHFTSRCPRLVAARFDERIKIISSHKLCFNCLRQGHNSDACKSSNCRQCGKRHHTIIHGAQTSAHPVLVQDATLSDTRGNEPVPEAEVSVNNSTSCGSAVLLPTAIVHVHDSEHRVHSARALLDSGSQPNLITQRLAKTLNLRIRPAHVDLCGITSSSFSVIGQCDVLVESRTSAFSANIPCLILSTITSYRPAVKIPRDNIQFPNSLADPEFDSDRSIDLLIGATYFFQLISFSEFHVGSCLPKLRGSKLGWLISGRAKGTRTQACDATAHVCSLDSQLSQFWEIETISDNQSLFTSEEKQCENHFKTTFKRTSSGRFVVTIPLSRSPNELGNSYTIACNRFLALESKLYKNSRLRAEYIQFMREYIDLGHMSLKTNTLTHTTTNEFREYYIPHHGVHNKSKLRVVFDASAKTSNGISFNDIQNIGPKLQNDLVDILIRFRKHKIAVSADIKMMYRQIEITEEQRPLQRIIWRENRDHPLAIYTLNTVTYGTASAPFLALRCLRELANSITNNPEAKRATLEDFYVDDLLTGGNTREEVVAKCKEITSTLSSAGMVLHKWVANDIAVLNNLSPSANETIVHHFNDGDPSKILGLKWSSDKDQLSFNSIAKSPFTSGAHLTKRKILSLIATLFDPLGLISPCIIRVKMFMQTLWAQKIGWDEPIHCSLRNKFLAIWEEMHFLAQVSVPRGIISNFKGVHLHGFADASEKAYGCCVYICIPSASISNILIAKSKVAPLSILTIPRLELCAALLLGRLVSKSIKALQLDLQSVTLWTDSTVVLGWLKRNPTDLKTFVAHRVSEIQAQAYQWRHVPSNQNPADLISRGLSPKLILSNALWWHGPPFLKLQSSRWPTNITNFGDIPELKTSTMVSNVNITSSQLINFSDYSTLTRLERIFAFIYRFVSKLRKTHISTDYPGIQLAEIEGGLLYLVRLAQNQSFKTEIQELSKNSDTPPSKLRRLGPFLDNKGILRVGGRLKNANLSYDQTHPILIDGKHPLAKLIMEQTHIRLLHVGAQCLLYATRQKYWITSGGRLARKIVFNCIPCFRARPAVNTPLMGQLPQPRITQQFAFAHTGVDFAGPIMLKTTNTRGCKQFKAYLAVFVCFATKAIHLDVVTSLSAESFIATLRRFVGRRGIPKTLYSDNGRNFVGANSELRKLFKFIANEKNALADLASDHAVDWKFIPPRAPHFGGLWEAAVKSVKYHLYRVIADRAVTFEDMSTMLIQIEGILNSRPLSALSNDPHDISPLTPAHFLIGRPITSLPDPDLSHLPDAKLSSFQKMQATVQHFWRRWKKEYLHQLQHRPKWTKKSTDPAIGQLCVILEENSHPTSWRMARIIDVHPGSDGTVRVVTLKTANGEMKRPTTKIAILPISYDDGTIGND